jgi:cell division protein FtsL
MTDAFNGARERLAKRLKSAATISKVEKVMFSFFILAFISFLIMGLALGTAEGHNTALNSLKS